jgi:hypothetical protein
MEEQLTFSGIDLPIVGYKGFRATIKEKASLSDTLKNMKRIAERDTYQVRELAKELEGSSVEETSRNIWDFIRENLTYKLDTEGIEELRTPARTLHDKIFDCDDATILTSAILLNLGISHEYRITAYKEKGKFSHIYPVAFDDEGRSYVIDTVPEIPHFNYEEQPIIDLKTVRMELHELSGVKEAVGQEEMKQDLLDELNEPFSLSGYEDDNEDDDMLLESSFLSGLGEVDSADEADVVIESKSDALRLIENGILAEVHKALQTLKKEQQSPTVLSETIDVEKEKSRLQSLIESWGDEQTREEIIEEALDENSSYKNFYEAIRMSLEELSSESNELSGTDDDEPIYLARIEAVDLSDMIEDEEGYFDDELSGRRSRRRARRRKFFKKIGKKVGNTIKKIGKAVVRFNPATIALRNATLLVLKLNLFNIASNVIYGYLTRDEAIAKKLDLNEWSKVVSAKNKLEKFFTKAGGKSKNFRNAVIRGRAAKKTGIHLSGLGEATAAASTAAASGFIVFAKKVLSAINPVTLFKKVKSSIQARKAAKNISAEKAINNSRPQNMQNEFNSGAADSTAVNQTAANDWEAAANQSGKDGILQKIKNIWITHKKKVIGTGMMIVVAIVFLLVWGKYKKKKKRQLAGIKAARTRARNRKAAAKRLPARRTTARGKSTRAKRRITSKVKTLGRGNTTVVRTPSKGRGKTRVYKQSSKSRLSLMHAKAKQLQKKHPKTKYSNLLKMAAKQI